MANPQITTVIESVSDLKKLLKKATPMIAPRIKMLLVEKKHSETGISRRVLAAEIGVDPNSITNWRVLYKKGGIDLLQTHKKTGFKKSVFSAQVQKAIEKKLNDPSNGLRGYTELQTFLEKKFNTKFKYNTLLKFCIKNFKSSVKTARKSHVKKDEVQVATFKKTLVKPVKKQ